MAPDLSTMIHDMRPGERLSFSGCVSVELIQKSGRTARLRVIAPRDVAIKKDFANDAALRGKRGEISIAEQAISLGAQEVHPLGQT